MTAQEVHKSPWFQRILRWGHVGAWVVLIGVVAAQGVQYQQVQHQAHQAKQTAAALATLVNETRQQARQLKVVVDDTHAGGCTLQKDLRDRAQGTLDYLRQHPEGFAGVPADVLRTNAKNQLRTARTLNRLHCDQGGP